MTRDLGKWLVFPFRDLRATDKLLIGYVLMLAAPLIIPWIFLLGYLARVARHVLATGEPTLPEWGIWGEDWTRGLRVFLAGLTLTLPLILVLGLWLGAWFTHMALMGVLSRHGDWPWPIFTLIGMFWPLTALAMLYSLALVVLGPPAIMHVIAREDYAALFAWREWWPIFRANWQDFVTVAVLIWGLSLMYSTLVQAFWWALCLFGYFLGAAFRGYLMLISSSMYARAYRDGLEALRQKAVAPKTV